MFSFFTFLMIASVVAMASAHMQMTNPPPLRSKFNPHVPESQYDYSMTAPLVASGTYPCKGYINDGSSMASVATWSAGSTVSYTIEGTAVHGGGSCQVALSYDNGQTWSVIYSHIGGCLVEGLTEQIQLPADAPSGEAIFSWNWFNLVGNREMYQNCAVVTITNGGSGLDPATYPTPFVANAGVNQCGTIEGTEVVFPNPGPNVKYGGKYTGTTPAGPMGITGSNCVGPGARAVSGGAGGVAKPSSSSPAVQPSATPTPTPSAQHATPSASGSTWSLVVAPPQSSGKVEHVTVASSSAQPATSSVKTCKKRKRSSAASSRGLRDMAGGLEVARRHERFLPRSMLEDRQVTGRVAALPAVHLSPQA